MNDRQPQRQDQTTLVLRIALVIAVGYLIVTVFSPFLTAIAWGAILSFALYPLYRRLLRATRQRQSLSAFLMCIAVIIGVILPISYITFSIVDDLTKTFRTVAVQVQKGEGIFKEGGWENYPLIRTVVDRFEELERTTGTDIRAAIARNLTDFGRDLVVQLTNVAKNILLAVVQLVIVLICCFYFFKDGEALVTWARETLPFPLTREHPVVQRFGEVVRGSIYGNTLVAISEGVIGGIGFGIVGLPSPVLWGTVMGLLAYLPVVGASVVWIPAAIYLYTQAAYIKVAILITTGVLIGIFEYFVRPICVGRASKIHALLVLFSVLGGLKLFGLLGIVLGPLIVAVGVTLLETYRVERSLPDFTKPVS